MCSLIVSGGWTSKIRYQYGEALVRALVLPCTWLSSHCVLTRHFLGANKPTILLDLNLTLYALISLHDIPQSSISKYSLICREGVTVLRTLAARRGGGHKSPTAVTTAPKCYCGNDLLGLFLKLV